jgi:hypothetical protein
VRERGGEREGGGPGADRVLCTVREFCAFIMSRSRKNKDASEVS